MGGSTRVFDRLVSIHRRVGAGLRRRKQRRPLCHRLCPGLHAHARALVAASTDRLERGRRAGGRETRQEVEKSGPKLRILHQSSTNLVCLAREFAACSLPIPIRVSAYPFQPPSLCAKIPVMKAVVIIPARMAATRFPGKPLADIHGKPMIQWVFERASAARRVSGYWWRLATAGYSRRCALSAARP